MRRLKVLPRLALATAFLLGPLATAASAEVPISGEGSSFVLIEVDQWRADVSKPPFNLVVNYVGSSSGNGRRNFAEPVANRPVDFAISDIPYVGGAVPPPIPFAYVPISAGGMAFMFNLKDKAGRRIRDLKLTPETACKIFTNQITKWSDPLLLADNPKLRPGVSQDKIKLVLRNGAAGTSFILGQYCIATAPSVWDLFQTDSKSFPGVPAQGYDGAPGPPTNQWPVPFGAVNAGNSDGNADQVANEATGESSICVVETGFAKNRKFPVASVKNAAGVFMQPTDSAVTKALSYAGDDPTGTQKLDFATPDEDAYNPSTYSYALVPTSAEGLDAAKGTVLAKFLNYAVGAGQESAEVLGYAPLPQNLVNLGFELIAKIPGAPPKESYTAVPPRAPLVVEEEDPGTTGGDGGGGQTPAAGNGGGDGGQTPAAGSGGGDGGQTPAAGNGATDGTGSASGNDGGSSGSGDGESGTASGGNTPAAGGASAPGATPGASTPGATVKGNAVTNAKTTIAAKAAAAGNTAGGNKQVAAGVFVEQASERPVDKDSLNPLAWVLALGATSYLLARRGRKSVAP